MFMQTAEIDFSSRYGIMFLEPFKGRVEFENIHVDE